MVAPSKNALRKAVNSSLSADGARLSVGVISCSPQRVRAVYVEYGIGVFAQSLRGVLLYEGNVFQRPVPIEIPLETVRSIGSIAVPSFPCCGRDRFMGFHVATVGS